MQRKLAQLDTEQYWSTVLHKATDKELADDLTRVVGRIAYETKMAQRIKQELTKRGSQ